MKEYKTCEEVLQALKDGKKVVGIGHLRRLCEGGIGCQEQKWYKVLYYYCNPQMNRTFAMLENGLSVDSNIDVLDFLYGKFYEYEDIEKPEVPRKLTKEQIEEELGYKIEIVNPDIFEQSYEMVGEE